MFSLYYLDQPLNKPPPFMSGLSRVLRSSQRKQFTWCQDLSTCQLGRSQRQGQVQPFACTENIWRQDDPPFSTFLVLGSFSLHVNSPQDSGFQAFKWEYRFLELYSGFHSQAFFAGFRIPQTKISWISESTCPYKKIAHHQPQGVQHHRFYL